MNPRQTELLLRRKQLRIKIATQRLHIAQIAQPWQEPLHKADRVLDTLRSLRRHPALLAGLAGMAGILLWRRGGLASLSRVALRAWGAYRSLSAFARWRRH